MANAHTGEAADRTFLGGTSALFQQSCFHQLRCTSAVYRLEQKPPQANIQTLMEIRQSLFESLTAVSINFSNPSTFPNLQNANQKTHIKLIVVECEEKH